MDEAAAIAEVFRRMEVNARDFPGIYVLCSFAKPCSQFSKQPRVTLVSQQIRALNLVYALAASGRLKPNDRVCIIGGGVAGLTAAAAVAHRKAEVTLLESKGTVLPLLRNTTRRWLHPYLYEWPEEESERLEADLPLINWRAATADHVVEQIDSAFKRCQSSGTISTQVNVTELNLRKVGDQWEVSWHGGPKRFNVVIVATGFGVEKGWPYVDHLSYWDNDNLDRETPRQQVQQTHHFISGCGDGGLIDFIRVRLRQFDHEGTFSKFLRIAPGSALRDRLREIEERASGDGGKLTDEYNHLRGSEIEGIDKWIKGRLRPSTSATLHGQSRYAYATNAATLSRFLVSRILKADASIGSRYQSGVLLSPIERDGDGRYVVALRDEHGKRVEARFDKVTIRHGVDPALEKLNPAFGDSVDFAAACRLLPSGAEPDPTRSLLCDPSYFGGIAPLLTALRPLPDPDASEIHLDGTDALVPAQAPRFEPSGVSAPSTPASSPAAAPPPEPVTPPIATMPPPASASMPAAPAPNVPTSGARYSPGHYISRPREEKRARILLRDPGRPVLLYGPDQRGKSWLFEHLVALMRDEARTKVVRLLPGELNTLNLDGFLHDLALRIADRLAIAEDIVTAQWKRSGSSQLRFGRTMRSIVQNTMLNDVDSLVLAIDWQEMLRACSFRDEAVMFLKSLCTNEEVSKLRLILTLPTSPVWVTSVHSAPMNVTDGIPVDDFKDEQVNQLVTRHGPNIPEPSMSELRRLIGGHPYLWTLLLEHVLEDEEAIRRIIDDPSYRKELFKSHIDSCGRWLAGHPEYHPAIRALLNGDLPEGFLIPLEDAGFIWKPNGRPALRYALYKEQFPQMCQA